MRLPANILKRAKATTAAPAPKVRVPRGMNGLEREYAARLSTLRAAGQIEWWAYQPVRLLIAHGGRRRFYTPDFMVLTTDGETQFHETKGHMREAAAVRLDVAVSVYPYSFFLVTREQGDWVIERIPRKGGSLALA